MITYATLLHPSSSFVTRCPALRLFYAPASHRFLVIAGVPYRCAVRLALRSAQNFLRFKVVFPGFSFAAFSCIRGSSQSARAADSSAANLVRQASPSYFIFFKRAAARALSVRCRVE
eukprot:s2497_g21.t1